MRRVSFSTSAALGAMAIVAVQAAAALAAEGPIGPISGPLVASENFAFTELDDDDEEDARRSVSGMACRPVAGGALGCVIAFDEQTEAQYAVISETSFKPSGKPVLLGRPGAEMDAEGVAMAGATVYVTGSHSVTRHACAPNKAARVVARFELAGAADWTKRDAKDRPETLAVSKRLWKALKENEALRNYADKCLGTVAARDRPKLVGERGLNIEGLAMWKGRLAFGLRGPVENDRTRIVLVDPKALFHQAADKDDLVPLEIATVETGQDRGIRDMQAVTDGLLLLVGPNDDSEDGPPDWGFVRWDGAKATRLVDLKLNDLPPRAKFKGCKDKGIKPEAMFVAAESDAAYRVVVMSDGLCDGGPMWFDVPRK